MSLKQLTRLLHNRINSVPAIAIAIVLFVVPFFWLKSGYVDLGGDAGRLYLLDPVASALHKYENETVTGASIYAFIPYELFLGLLHKIIPSSTYLIATDQGIVLSLAFYSMYLIVCQLFLLLGRQKDRLVDWVGIATGIVYIGFISKSGWIISLPSYYQFFLNPLLFYLFLRYILTDSLRYALGILFVTVVYSGNFGYSSAPQLVSFFPLTFIYLYILVRWVLHKTFPWKRFIGLGLVFLLLHAFHLVPTIASIIDSGSIEHTRIFSKTIARNDGILYFDATRQTLGKLSETLFGSHGSVGSTIILFIVPVITFIGFLYKRKKLLVITGIFFALLFYLVSANITLLGVRLYRMLFYIPGFVMFRSFNDKWYSMFVFFYTLLFGLSFYSVLQKRNRFVVWLVSALVIGSVMGRIAPFLTGSFYRSTLYESRNVPVTYEMDPHLMDAISYIRTLPDNGNVLTLPLTLPYYQVIYGKSGGAYVGISLVSNLTGKKDYSGLWSFGAYQSPLEHALAREDNMQVLQLLSLLGVRYIFRDTDVRIMTDFPNYPFYRFDRSTDIPPIDSQHSYDQLLKQFPLTTRYEKGFFRIQEFDDTVVRPTIYIPDVVYASLSGVLSGSSFRSAYIDADSCNKLLQCGVAPSDIPQVSFQRVAPETYSVNIDLGRRIDPFLVIVSEDYHKSWSFELNGMKLSHVLANGYANSWIIDPKLIHSRQVTGIIQLGFRNYFIIGKIISCATLLVIIALIVWYIVRKKYEKS